MRDSDPSRLSTSTPRILLLASWTFVVTAILPLPAAAWQSEVHMGMTQLTRTIYQVPGLAASDRTFVFPAAAGAACYGEGSKPSTRSKLPDLRRIFLDLVCGSDEPDNERNPFKSQRGFFSGLGKAINNHKSNPGPYALEEFKQAVATHRQRAGKGTLPYAEAARHLGRSLHYLGDVTDVTVKLSSRTHDDLRRRAAKIVVDYLNEWKGPYPPGLGKTLDNIHWREGVSHGTPEAIVSSMERERTIQVKRIEDKQFVLRDFVEKIIFVQERWVALYLDAIAGS